MGISSSSPVLNTKFDQSFSSYLDKHNLTHVPYKQPTSCLLLKRDINFSHPQINTNNTTNNPNTDEELVIVKNLLNHVNGVRTYFIHIPPCAVNFISPTKSSHSSPLSSVQLASHEHGCNISPSPPGSKFPMVICLHGTDETAFDGELLKQVDGKLSWLGISEKENCVILFPQSRGQWASGSQLNSSWRPEGDLLRSLWLLSFVENSQTDLHYLQAVVDDVFELLTCIDPTQIYILGFSNGGFMAADILLHLDTLKFAPAAVCCYMGGLEQMQLEEIEFPVESLPLPPDISLQFEGEDSAKPALYIPASRSPKPLPLDILPLKCAHVATQNKPSVLIMTGVLDVQLGSCCKAWESFSYLGFNTHLCVLNNAHHEYLSSSTPLIWQFFRGAACKGFELF